MEKIKIEIDSQRLLKDLKYLKTFTATPEKGVSRFSYGPMDKKVREYLISEAEKLAISWREDAIGNMFFSILADKDKDIIWSGSHIDTVYQGGWLDGIYGSMAAFEVLRRIAEEKPPLSKAIEVVIFAEEEGSNFNSTLVGSKFMTGVYKEEDLTRLKNREGFRLIDMLEEGGFPKYHEKSIEPNWSRIKGLVELHIEQGPVLVNKGIGLGLVESISGMRVLEIIITGQGNHAGATPMEGRKDALAGASLCITEIEKVVREVNRGSEVATVGKIFAEPNASNVIPGKVTFTYEVRSPDEKKIKEIVEMAIGKMKEIAKERDLEFSYKEIAYSEPYAMDQRIIKILKDTAEGMGEEYLLMASGPVHDSGMISKKIPAALVFVPSIKGRSHVAEEDTKEVDLIRGAEFLMNALLKLAE